MQKIELNQHFGSRKAKACLRDFTWAANKNFELNFSSKYIHSFDDEDWRFFALNLGLGLSSDLNKYVIRPEIGWAFDTKGNLDTFQQFGIGVTFYPAGFKK